MPKLTAFALTLALLDLPTVANAACLPDTIVSSFAGECNYDNFVASLSSGCTPAELFPNMNSTEIVSHVTALCEYDVPVQFVEILGSYQDDRRYFAGGGDLVDADPDHWHVTTGNLRRFEDNVGASAIIAFPEYAARVKYNQANGGGNNGYPANMNLETSCDLRTIMCCFTADYDGFDGGDGFDGDATADVCRHDLRDSPQSNHVSAGWAVFPGVENTPAHCVGFTWTDDEFDLVGNMMYDVSLRNTLTKGYRKGVPGAPMCGCVEHMPVVESSTCRTATRDGEITNVFSFRDGYVSAHNEASIAYGECKDGMDLSASYKSKNPTTANAIDAHLVGTGNCASDLSTYLMEEQFLVEDASHTRFVTPDASAWDQAIGMGTMFLPPQVDPVVADAHFRKQINACQATKGRMCIVRRVCHSCNSVDHRDMFYKRLSPLPPSGTNTTAGEVYFLDVFMNRWASYMNVLNDDFELYGSYDDAVAGTNKWLFCNYDYFDHPIGFPRDCGPFGYVGDQWNSYSGWMPLAYHHGYFVEKS